MPPSPNPAPPDGPHDALIPRRRGERPPVGRLGHLARSERGAFEPLPSQPSPWLKWGFAFSFVVLGAFFPWLRSARLAGDLDGLLTRTPAAQRITSTPTVYEAAADEATPTVVIPTATSTSTSTPTLTASPTRTSTPTLAPTRTMTPTLTPSPTATPAWVTAKYLPLPLDEKWIEVDLTQQRLTAYEGEDAVFATEISSGKDHTPTVLGKFRIKEKRAAQLMAGPGYYLPDVPWVMYFYARFALHGAYWHDKWGTPTSHGCVNLRIEDARWIYDWSDPPMPEGTDMLFTTNDNLGTWVLVHK